MRQTMALAIGLMLAGGGVAAADKSYGPGVSDNEIKLGQSIPYSGPASALRNLTASPAAVSCAARCFWWAVIRASASRRC